jgi:hypothetical protein
MSAAPTSVSSDISKERPCAQTQAPKLLEHCMAVEAPVQSSFAVSEQLQKNVIVNVATIDYHI